MTLSFRLILLRHAKSDWNAPGLADFDRPLSPRGHAAAPIVGSNLAEHQLNPHRILCSTARRTRETLAHILPSIGGEVDIQLLDAMYEQSENDYAGLIRRFGGEAPTLLLVGHNPATEETAMRLSETPNGPICADMRQKFPTAAYAYLEFAIDSWSDLSYGSGRLISFIKPRDLAGHPQSA